MNQHDFKPASLFYKRPSKSASIVYNGCGCLVILTILTAIALPSYLNSVSRAPKSEAKQYLSSMNRAQQAYYAEKGNWATSIAALGIGIKTETTNYKYAIRMTKEDILSYGLSKQKKLPSYVGGIFLVTDGDVKTTSFILCESDDRGTIEPAEPTYQNGEVICGKGTTLVSK